MFKSTLTLAVIMLTLSAPAMAQDNSSTSLPEACQPAMQGTAMAMPEGTPMDQSTTMDEAHTALMAGMDSMNRDMMKGGEAPDLDVAFVCAMIPHHQGAISMAQAELKYGKDDWTKAMAQKVIDAQTQEIADMTKWLAEHKQ